MKATIREERVMIPTYEIREYDKNPMFLEKRVYQGSSGRVYPHPMCNGIANEKTEHEYKAVILENDYIYVMILPELGGRVQRLLDKTNGYDAVYYNEVVKPALVGLAGPWISGGIEFNWPQHHRPSTFDETDHTLRTYEDGSVACIVGETEKMFHTKSTAEFRVYPDRAYLEINARLYNPTDRPQTFLWWANPAVAVNENTQSIFPQDVNAVYDHGKRDVSKFPISDSVYYKVNYAPGTDISRYKNIPVPTSYMANHSDYDFVGNYDHGVQAGLLHVADHHVSPGKKQWTWGNGDFGKAWDRNLTDANGPYIELMTGVFTDNQPDFTFIKPYEEKTFTQYFFPYKQVGEVKNANKTFAVGVKNTEEGVKLTVYSTRKAASAELHVSAKGQEILCENIVVSPDQVYEKLLTGAVDEKDVSFEMYCGEIKVLDYAFQEREEEIPDPATALKAPSEIQTNEELFLAATHLEQYRHATYDPKDYYLEALRRDETDIRVNNGYGKYLYNRGKFAESKKYFEAAIKKSTWKNPNPYDCEAYFNLGLVYKKLGENRKAYDNFYKATWDQAQAARGFYQLACIAVGSDPEIALKHVEASLVNGLHNMKARTLKTYLLRKLGKVEAAAAFARETSCIDPLDMGSRYELAALTGEYETFLTLMRGEDHNFVELALTYMDAGLQDEALAVLKMAPGKEPMVHYYRYFNGDAAELAAAEAADSAYCFPNRVEDIPVLQKAVEQGAGYAMFYLGNLYYDKGQWEDAVALFEAARDRITLPTVLRNLSIAYYNKKHDKAAALDCLQKAFAGDPTDVEVFYELDQLLKITGTDVKTRLEAMEKYPELLVTRDDLYTEYITLLNSNGLYEKAYEKMMAHSFHPWEGGEGKITAQYRIALMGIAETKEKEEAKALLTQALVYPYNLGEGKLIGNLDNDLYYKLGCLEEDAAKQAEYFKLASRGEFVLSAAMYYNDQPPEMMYYATLAEARLGQVEMAKDRFEKMIAYCEAHIQDHCKVDYFAVSLPDFLIFEGNMDEQNRKHCEFLKALGQKGLEILAL